METHGWTISYIFFPFLFLLTVNKILPVPFTPIWLPYYLFCVLWSRHPKSFPFLLTSSGTLSVSSVLHWNCTYHLRPLPPIVSCSLVGCLSYRKFHKYGELIVICLQFYQQCGDVILSVSMHYALNLNTPFLDVYELLIILCHFHIIYDFFLQKDAYSILFIMFYFLNHLKVWP